MLVNKAHILIKDGIGTHTSILIKSEHKLPMDTNQSLSLIAASKDDNMKSNDLDEGKDEGDMTRKNCSAY